MGRLTNKKEADAQRLDYENRLKNGYPRSIPEERYLKLAAYEDTGLEPEEIIVLKEPPNDPLTLEELREMDGEPVWVISPDYVFEPCWMLVMLRNDFVMANWQFCDFGEYGKTWMAFRRRPDENPCT